MFHQFSPIYLGPGRESNSLNRDTHIFISPAEMLSLQRVSGLFQGLLLVEVKNLTEGMPRRHPSHLNHLNWMWRSSCSSLNSSWMTELQPFAKGEHCHPLEEAHLQSLYPRAHPFGHNLKLVTIGEGYFMCLTNMLSDVLAQQGTKTKNDINKNKCIFR